MRVLVAEDSSSARKMMTRILESAAHDVVTAVDGLEALEKMSAADGPQIAILDWLMPKLDGVDVCRTLRKNRKSVFIYIIIVTARTDKNTLVDAFDAGADDYIPKPYSAEELLARVRAGVRIIELNNENAAYVVRLQHKKKMESIGQLAAGTAHEINTPAQYIGDNARFISSAYEEILTLINLYDELTKRVAGSDRHRDFLQKIAAYRDEIEFDYLKEEIPNALNQCVQGIDAIARIISALKEFAQPATDKKVDTDILRILKNTIAISQTMWKHVARMELDVAPDLPPVRCIAGDIEQVLINLISNSVDAIERKFYGGSGILGVIKISAYRRDDDVVISVSDNGSGIPEAVRLNVFEPFFTTKEMARGMGYGLAIAHDIIVKRHRGLIEFDTAEGEGTSFRICIPLSAPL